MKFHFLANTGSGLVKFDAIELSEPVTEYLDQYNVNVTSGDPGIFNLFKVIRVVAEMTRAAAPSVEPGTGKLVLGDQTPIHLESMAELAAVASKMAEHNGAIVDVEV